MKKVLLPIAGVMLFIVAIGLLQNRFAGSFYNPIQQNSATPTPTPALEQKEILVGETAITVEVAKTDEERRQGLSGREPLRENTGMLFDFDENSRPSFWMKDMNFAIDIIWIDDGEVVAIKKEVQPEPDTPEEELTLYPAPQPIDYVLEVNAGYSEENNIEVGDSVDLSNFN